MQWSHVVKPSRLPSSKSLTIEAAETAVPPLLYNFLASVCGRADDSELVDRLGFCELPSSTHSKLLSICQDIVNLKTNGRVTTPKSLALGITLRHRTGSADLKRIMHSLGHCASYDSVTRAETAIAMAKLQNPVTVPEDFVAGALIILVFDNIDFKEQTLSVAGTTHQIKGIMFQRKKNSPESNSQITHSTSISRRTRALNLATQVLEPYILGKRCGIPVASAMHEKSLTNVIVQDYKLQS